MEGLTDLQRAIESDLAVDEATQLDGAAAPLSVPTERVGEGTRAPAPITPLVPREFRARWIALTLRWAIIAALAFVAFHASLDSLVRQNEGGDLLAYVLLLPLWAGLAAAGKWLREEPDLPIDDRQVDWIVAGALLLLMAMVDGLLAPRLGLEAQLWRVDLLSLVLFVAAGCVALFGTCPAGRYWAPWIVVAASWPLVYRLVGALLGGTVEVFALLNVLLASVSVFVAVGGRLRRRLAATAVTMLLGAAGTIALSGASPTVRTLVPAAVAPLLVAGIVLRDRIAGRRRPRSRPLTVRRTPWAAVAGLAVAAAVLAWLSPAVPGSVDGASLPSAGPALVGKVPKLSGWKPVHEQRYAWAASYFGSGSTLRRVVERPEVAGSTRSTASTNAGGAPLGVDVLTTGQTGRLSVYPATSSYELGNAYVRGGSYALGHGVTATLYYNSTALVQRPTDLASSMLTWTWRVDSHGSVRYQRVNVISPDVEIGVGRLPEPTAPAASHSLRATVSMLVRGSYGEALTEPGRATIGRLVDAGRQFGRGCRPRIATP